MNYRRATILAERSITAAGTEVIPIREGKPISRIDIAWRVTKASTNNQMMAQPAADITKIELIDGSDVLFSLSGYEAQALCIYDRKVPTMNYGQHIASSYEFSTYGIDFGRMLWDKHLALDPSKFTNLVLNITHNLAVADTGATQAYLEVMAHIFDEKVVTPIGFLSAKEIFAFTPGADGAYEYIALPTDYVMRQLLVRGFYIAYDPHEVIEGLKLDEDNDARVPLDMDMEDYSRYCKGVMTPVQEQCVGYIHTGADHIFYVTPTDMCCVEAGLGIGNSTSPVYVNSYPRGGQVDARCAESVMFVAKVFGWLPNHCWSIPFGDQQDLDDWYDVTRVGHLRLRLESGTYGNSGTSQVVTQQLRRY